MRMPELEGSAIPVLGRMAPRVVLKVTGTLGMVDGGAFVMMRQVSESFLNIQTR